jgi:hypothetical protein
MGEERAPLEVSPKEAAEQQDKIAAFLKRLVAFNVEQVAVLITVVVVCCGVGYNAGRWGVEHEITAVKAELLEKARHDNDELALKTSEANTKATEAERLLREFKEQISIESAAFEKSSPEALLAIVKENGKSNRLIGKRVAWRGRVRRSYKLGPEVRVIDLNFPELESEFLASCQFSEFQAHVVKDGLPASKLPAPNFGAFIEVTGVIRDINPTECTLAKCQLLPEN